MKKITKNTSTFSKKICSEIDIVKLTRHKECDLNFKKYDFNKVISNISTTNNKQNISLNQLEKVICKKGKNMDNTLLKYQNKINEITNVYPYFSDNRDIEIEMPLYYIDPYQSKKYSSLKKYSQEDFYSAHNHYIYVKKNTLYQSVDKNEQNVLFAEVFSSIQHWHLNNDAITGDIKGKPLYHQNADKVLITKQLKHLDAFYNTHGKKIKSSVLYDRGFVLKLNDLNKTLIGYPRKKSNYKNINPKDKELIENIFVNNNCYTIIDNISNCYYNHNMLSVYSSLKLNEKSNIIIPNTLDKPIIDNISKFNSNESYIIKDLPSVKSFFKYFHLKSEYDKLFSYSLENNALHKYLKEVSSIIQKYNSINNLMIGNYNIKHPNGVNVVIPILENYKKYEPISLSNTEGENTFIYNSIIGKYELFIPVGQLESGSLPIMNSNIHLEDVESEDS